MINIYRIRLKDTPEWYVGQTKHHPEVRMYQHWSDRNKKAVCGIGSLMKDHLYEDFEVELLEKVEPSLARTKEQEWIANCGSLNKQNAVKDPEYHKNYQKKRYGNCPRVLTEEQKEQKRISANTYYANYREKVLSKELCPYCFQEFVQNGIRRHIRRIHPA